jgi:hypothetical protein
VISPAAASSPTMPRGVSSMVEQRTFNPFSPTAVHTCENAHHARPKRRQSVAVSQGRPDLQDRPGVGHADRGLKARPGTDARRARVSGDGRCSLLGLLRMLDAGQHHPDGPDFIIGQVPDAGASAHLDLPLLKQLGTVGAKS